MMPKNRKILGIITARGGSKGIPDKNIRPLMGKPLILYTIEAARQSKFLTRCIVSTESAEIAEIARRAGADVPFLRPKELATDESLALDVLAHVITELQKKGETYDYVLMLQPTSPLRTAADIDACIELAVKNDADSVFSLKKIPDFAIQKLKKIGNGEIKPLLEEERGQSAPRHKGPDVYKRNCAIYLTRTALILKGDQFGRKSMAYVMPEERSIDINTPTDFELAEFWLKKMQ